jgi:hypothetical protein
MSLLLELGLTAEAIDHLFDRVGRYYAINHFKSTIAAETAT